MGAEPGFISSHTATTGTALVQTSPNIQAVNGESAVTACQLMSISPRDSKAYLCDLNTMHCIPAGFAAANHPLSTNVDDTTKVTLIRQGRIRGFSGLVPGALYYPSADTAGAVVPERASAGPVITAVEATSGSAFLCNVHIRAGHRPTAGNWTITFLSATTCVITPPGGSAGAAFTVANNSTYNGTITGAESFFIETQTVSTGCAATVTVSYSTEAAMVITLNSPGNAFTAFAPLSGMAGKNIAAGFYQVETTASSVMFRFNGGALSAAMTIAAGKVYFDIIPGMALTTQGSAVTAETNYFVIGTQELAAPVGIAINESTIQILMGGIG
ncbi:MAG: hypothetical protein Q8O92_12430 [Candidatus Latescibacter sp.]|nr:hypothetical protein [Candidatus Latescibacter sp.]